MLVLLSVSCAGRAVTPYPPGTCADDSCRGRVTTLGLLARDEGSKTKLLFLDLEKPLSDTGQQQLLEVTCDGCPFQVGATYRARMNGLICFTCDGDDVYSLLLDGTEIYTWETSLGDPARTRPDGLTLGQGGVHRSTCGAQPAHWEAVNGVATCVPGATGPPIKWVSGDGLNPPQPGCSPSFPTGFLDVNGEAPSPVGISLQLSVSKGLVGDQEFHDFFPQQFADALNSVYQGATGHPGGRHFVLADGPALLYFAIVVTTDATNDHYGMTVTVRGPQDRATYVGGGTTATLFSYTVPALYLTEKVLQQAARRAVELLYLPGGWSCAHGVATPRYALDRWCADQIRDNPNNTSAAQSWVCQPH